MLISIDSEENKIEIGPTLIKVIGNSNGDKEGIRYYAITDKNETIEVEVNEELLTDEVADEILTNHSKDSDYSKIITGDSDTFNRYTIDPKKLFITNPIDTEVYYSISVISFLLGRPTRVLWSAYANKFKEDDN